MIEKGKARKLFEMLFVIKERPPTDFKRLIQLVEESSHIHVAEIEYRMKFPTDFRRQKFLIRAFLWKYFS